MKDPREREHLIDLVLGQCDELTERQWRARLAAEPRLRAEFQSMQRIVRLLRGQASLRASPGFQATLNRRLDALQRPAFRIAAPSLVAAAVLLIGALLTVVWAFEAIWPGQDHSTPSLQRDRSHSDRSSLGPSGAREGSSSVVSSDPFDAPEEWEPLSESSEERRSSSKSAESAQSAEAVASNGFEGSELLESQESIQGHDTLREQTRLDARTVDLSRLRLPGSPRSNRVANGSRPTVRIADAVAKGAGWLMRQQQEDGGWLTRTGEPGLEPGVTGLAVLALLSTEGSSGLSLDRNAVRASIERGVRALRAAQDRRDGSIGRSEDEAVTCFNHSVACLALTEHYVSYLRHLQDPAAAPSSEVVEERDGLCQGLDFLELLFERLLRFQGELHRCSAQNVAWASLALATAKASESHGGHWYLRADTPRKVEEILARLSGEQPLVIESTALMVHALHRSDAIDSGTQARAPDEWARIVTSLLDHPADAEPSLCFFVASGLQQRAQEAQGMAARWDKFRKELEQELLTRFSDEHGHFVDIDDYGWECFAGGDVYESALALLTLQVPSRQVRK